MRSDRLRQGAEILSDPTYLRVCRSVFAFRLIACALTAALTPTTSALSATLLSAIAILSIWAMLDNAFTRRYFSHPTLAAVDVSVIMVLLVLEWPDSLALLVMALTLLIVGLILSPWLSLPALILAMGATVLIGRGQGPAADERWGPAATVGLPLALVGMTVLGWTIRFAFVELHRSRDLLVLRELAQHELEERQRLARAMHDSLGKTVHGISLAATALRLAAEAGRREELIDLSRQIEAATATAADESRALLRGLRRHQDDRPVAEQLGELVRARARASLPMRTEVVGVADLPRALSREILAIADEALENIVRHSDAGAATVTLRRDAARLVLEIQDDGIGFEQSLVRERERSGHYGLRGMQERSEQSGGRCQIDSSPGAGALVRCEWPGSVVTKEED